MIININKPAGWTSFDVVKKVRGIIKEKKVGHAGTLDPFAEGVLVLGTGPDTKKLTDITTASKIYRAELTLGKATDTQDRDGKIIAEAPVSELTSPGRASTWVDLILESCRYSRTWSNTW